MSSNVDERLHRQEGRKDTDPAACHHRCELCARLTKELGVAKERIDTIVDFPAMQKYGVKFQGGAAAASAATLAELAEAIALGHLVVPIQRIYPLDDVRAAFTELEAGHVAGKIVVTPDWQNNGGRNCRAVRLRHILRARMWREGEPNPLKPVRRVMVRSGDGCE
jgi:hypothetical protein